MEALKELQGKTLFIKILGSYQKAEPLLKFLTFTRG
jgi:prephenate dehydratase